MLGLYPDIESDEYELVNLFQRLFTGFPAAHHLPDFVVAYKPACRVVAKSYLPAQLGGEES
jgi:hypothetical protein